MPTPSRRPPSEWRPYSLRPQSPWNRSRPSTKSGRPSRTTTPAARTSAAETPTFEPGSTGFMHWGWGAGGGRARVSHARTRASVSARAQEMMSVEPQPDDFLTQRETGQSRATRMRGDRPYAQRADPQSTVGRAARENANRPGLDDGFRSEFGRQQSRTYVDH